MKGSPFLWGLAGVVIAFGAFVVATKPPCTNPVMRLKFDITKPGLVCVVHAFDQDVVVQQ